MVLEGESSPRFVGFEEWGSLPYNVCCMVCVKITVDEDWKVRILVDFGVGCS